jgi:hypothetical protein
MHTKLAGWLTLNALPPPVCPYVQYLASEGFLQFLDWFDDRGWYPLGRIIGGTIYPGGPYLTPPTNPPTHPTPCSPCSRLYLHYRG